MQSVLLNCQANSTFGWGIFALNLLLQWANDPEVEPLLATPVTLEDLRGVDPLRLAVCRPAIERSNAFATACGRASGMGRHVAMPVIDALGNGLAVPGEFRGTVNFGRCVFDDTAVPREAARALAKYDRMLCVSRWNASLLDALGAPRPEVIFEGVDPALFHPGPRSGVLDSGRFYVFSGGKIEHRKAQDLTLLAFREFARRHAEAVLVTAWHSPWPKLAAGFRGRLERPVELNRAGQLDVRRWVADNGIDPERVIDVGRVPNASMPGVLREMDCALFPSRAEPGTSLPAKEAMACGVPAILADNTGMRDLIDAGNCLALRRQSRVVPDEGHGTEGWGESDVDEIVEALETLYHDGERRRAIGSRGAEWIVQHGRVWGTHAAALKRVVLAQARS